MRKSIYLFIFAFFFGFFTSQVVKKYLEPEYEETVREKLVIDTIFVEVRDTVNVKIHYPIFIKDTLIIYCQKEVVVPNNYYSGSEAIQYGEINWEANVSGELNSLNLYTSQNIPEITITRDIERTVSVPYPYPQKGVFAGAGVSNNGTYHFGLAYLGKNYIINANYTPIKNLDPIITLDAKFNIFKIK